MSFPRPVVGASVRSRQAALTDGSDLRLAGVLLMGALTAAAVGYLASLNPHVAPAHVGVVGRVAVVLMLIIAGVYAQTSKTQQRMGRLLVFAGFFSGLWLLQGSDNRLAFSVGVLCMGLAPAMFCYLMLAYPNGRLQSTSERRFMTGSVTVSAILWVSAVLTTTQPPLAGPLVRCVPHCPPSVFSLNLAETAGPLLKALIVLTWISISCGVVPFLVGRVRSASAPGRRSIIPVLLASVSYALSVLAFLLAERTGSPLAGTAGAVEVAIAVAIPLLILFGLTFERLFMGQALEEAINRLTSGEHGDLQTVMARALEDPSVRIAYYRPTTQSYVDASGTPVQLPIADSHHEVTRIERDGSAFAAVVYDAELSNQELFIQAAGGAALITLQNAQLEAELRASMADLAASRTRLVEAADAERRRIQRDLHDGAQQHLVAMRIRLAIAADAIREEPRRGEQMLSAIGAQIDEALEEIRRLAQGVYPPLLSESGLAEALGSVGRRAPFPVSVYIEETGRFAPDTEAAVYFCCLEALQNVAKHAGPDCEGALRLWREEQRVCFEVTDTGRGFTPQAARVTGGLINMHDRIEAVGGTVNLSSSEGHGTSVRGWVPMVSGPGSWRSADRSRGRT